MGDSGTNRMLALVVCALVNACAGTTANLAPGAALPAATHVIDGPGWETEVVAFAAVDPPEARPWRTDSRLAGQFHSAEYPDDVQVVFDATEGKTRAVETMWVTVLAYDARTDRFLGRLLNAPDHVPTVQEADNVVFHLGPPFQYRLQSVPDRAVWLVADDDGRGYAAQGWPRQRSSFVDALTRGVRAYRLGRFGHNQPEIGRCIQELRPVLAAEPTGASTHDLQVAHFVLARCLSESYETVEALSHFDRAVALDRKDPHARMGLIAELTLLSHSEKYGHAAVTAWRHRLVTEMQRMREDFPDQKSSLELLDMIRDRSQARPGMSAEEIELSQQIGFGVIRYKSR